MMRSFCSALSMGGFLLGARPGPWLADGMLRTGSSGRCPDDNLQWLPWWLLGGDRRRMARAAQLARGLADDRRGALQPEDRHDGRNRNIRPAGSAAEYTE